MSDFPDHSQAESTPRTQTESTRQRGSGAGADISSRVKTIVGFEKRRGSREPKMERIFGIDFGEVNTRVAVLRGGKPYFTRPGIFPSELHVFSENRIDLQNEPVVGGLRSKLLKSENLFPYAETGVKLFFKKVYECVNNAANSEHPKAVLTVPAYYNSRQRIRLKRCAESCGLEIIGLINDYAAIVHSFIAGRSDRVGTILVLSIGADAVSTALVKVHSGLIETVCSQSGPGIGGTKIIDGVANALMQKFDGGSSVLELTLEQSLVWRARAQDLLFKHAAGHEEIVFGDSDTRCVIRIPGSDLLELLSTGLESAIGLVDKVIGDSGISRTQIDFVLLVGGIVSNSVVAKYLARSFTRLHRMILNPDMAGSFGAALRAGVLDKQIDEPQLWDLLTQPVYKVVGDSQQIIIPSGISIPANFQTAINFVDSHIGQKEVESEDCTVSAESVVGAPRIAESVSLEVTVTADGILEVAALAELTE